MREFLENLHNIRFLSFGEATDDGERYEALRDGRLLVADSLHALLSLLADRPQPSLRLAA